MEEDNSDAAERQSRGKSHIASSSSSSSSTSKDISSLLSDAGSYSYAAMISLQLHELFDNQWDRKFCLECISTIRQHLNLPKNVESVMITLLNGEGGQSIDAYKDLLLREQAICGKGVLIIEDLLYMAVRGGKYDSRMRVLIQYLAKKLNVPLEVFELYEVSVVHYLTEESRQLTEEEQDEMKKKKKKRKIKRCAIIGLATLGGGALLGLTGGLAAPLIGAGVGTLLGAGSAAVLGSTAGIAIIGSLFGVAGAGLTGFKMKKRVGEIEEFAFEILTGDPLIHTELHITIAVSGWLVDDEPDNFTRPWRSLSNSREQYFLRYESQYLLELGRAIDYILSFAVSMAAQEALRYTILSGLIAAIGWPASLITLASVIDNPWSVCCRRSAEVGKQLAEVLLTGQQGQRPVTLIGYSLGARVIYYCLREMSERDGCEGIIQDAILLGTPVSGSKDWNKLTRVVAGRLVNGYSKSDWMLKFMYRTFSMALGVAGLQPINIDDRRIVNVDLTDVISGHGDYSRKIGEILKLINIRTVDEVPLTFHSLMKKSWSDTPCKRNIQGSLFRSKSDGSLDSRKKQDHT